jgi:hypothetical protein
MRTMASMMLFPLVLPYGPVVSTHDHMIPVAEHKTTQDFITSPLPPGMPASVHQQEYLRLCDAEFDAVHDPNDHCIWTPLRMSTHNI